MKDYYSILQVSSKDSLSKIKKQYKKLSLKYHPDKNKTKEASEKFIFINEAYDVLKDDYKRGRYDVEYEKYYNPFQNMMNTFNNMNFFKKKI
jgi:curved DNA-binding protein CbpA